MVKKIPFGKFVRRNIDNNVIMAFDMLMEKYDTLDEVCDTLGISKKNQSMLMSRGYVNPILAQQMQIMLDNEMHWLELVAPGVREKETEFRRKLGKLRKTG